jgi:hypothetical protein
MSERLTSFERPELTKEQDVALQHALQGMAAHDVVRVHILNVENGEAWSKERKALDELSIDKLNRAIYVGYTVQKTPEDKVRDWYFRIKEATNGDDLHQVKLNAIECTLNTLGLKIKGVND